MSLYDWSSWHIPLQPVGPYTIPLQVVYQSSILGSMYNSCNSCPGQVLRRQFKSITAGPRAASVRVRVRACVRPRESVFLGPDY